MSICHDMETWLSQAPAAAFPTGQQIVWERHVAHCDTCRQALLADRQADTWLATGFAGLHLPAHFASHVVAQALPASPGKQSKALLITIVLAAVVLAAIGVLWKPSGSAAHDRPPSLPQDRWMVTQIHSGDAPFAVIQDLTQGTDAVCVSGGLLASYRVETITPGGVLLTDTAHPGARLALPAVADPITPVNATIADCRPRFAQGALTALELEKLRASTRLGYDAAVELMYAASQTPTHPYHLAATDILAGGDKIKSLCELLQLAATQDGKHRWNALQGLAKIDSPLARQTLRKCAGTAGDPLRLAAIQGLAQQRDTGALPLLEAWRDDPNTSAAVKRAATSAFQQIVAAAREQK